VSEEATQAFIRFGRVLIVAALSAAVTHLGPLVDLINDPVYANIAMVALTALIEGILKKIGGATEQAPEQDGGAVRGRAAGPRRVAKRPNSLAI